MKKSKKTKPKIGIWARIKNIYDNSPGHAAFTYPIAYIILWTVVIGILASLEVPDIIGFTFMLAIFIAPIWVLIGIIIAKKRLPYLLSLLTGLVVIPALIAHFAYTSFTGSAKTAATKSNHASTVKYISAEIQKCKLGESKFMDFTQDCPATALKAINGTVATMTDWLNPFDTAKLLIRLSNSNTNDEDVGYISLSASGSDIIIKSCHKKPCSKEENRQTSTVSIE